MILSIGSHVNLKQPIGANVLHGEAYHHLARAAVCEIPLMDEPDFDELHALVSAPPFSLLFQMFTGNSVNSFSWSGITWYSLTTKKLLVTPGIC